MPELPEVESVRRQLVAFLPGRRVIDVWWDAHPHARLTDVGLVAGRQLLDITRRGKFLLLRLDPTPAGEHRELVLHLGMTGSLSLHPTASADADVHHGVTHVRAHFVLDDGQTLLFRDPRRFGRVSVVPAGEYAGRIPTLATLGPEPLSSAFDPVTFAAALATTRAVVKAKLLDQRTVAGIGNIYADEALWRAQIHPASRRVGGGRAKALHHAIIEVLAAAVEREGTTFRDYQMVNGESGRYAQFLDVYGKDGLPCRRCGAVLRKTTVAGRGTTYCPECQRH